MHLLHDLTHSGATSRLPIVQLLPAAAGAELSPAMRVGRWALLAVLSVSAMLTGCALAPGVYVQSEVERNGPSPDAPPPGALTSITPDLVRALRSVPQPDPLKDLEPFLAEAEPYRIGAGDVLSIIVWGSPEFYAPPTSIVTGPAAGGPTGPTTFVVSSQGFIQMPFVGRVKAVGLTEEELRAQLNEVLKSQIKKPEVTVAVQTYRSSRVYVDGEVRTPGQQVINDVPMTLPEALTRAGGLTPAADRSQVTLTRGIKTVRVNLDQLTNRGLDPQRILLAPGDTVRVGSNEDTRVYVLGEVASPGAKPLRKGKLSLHEALGDSGGVSNVSGNPRQIFVVRVTDPLKPEIFHLDASSPVSMALADGFDLRPRDVVYVDPVPLVRWNRVISLILPSATAVSVPLAISRSLN